MNRVIILMMVLLTYLFAASYVFAQDERPNRKKRSRAVVERQQDHDDAEHDQDHDDEEEDHDHDEARVAELEKRLEKWADQHSKSWEKWAERFESKMEAWAEETESEMEDWAEKYSGQWEKWAEELEDGLDEEKLEGLMKRNLEMLKEMPIAPLAKRLGQLGGDLEEMPLGSLGELQGLLADSIDLSLSELEESLGSGDASKLIDEAASESKEMLKPLLSDLQQMLKAKQKRQGRDAESRTRELQELLENRKFDSLEELEEMLSASRRDSANARNRDMKRSRGAKLAYERLTAQKEERVSKMKAIKKEIGKLRKAGKSTDKLEVQLDVLTVQVESVKRQLEAMATALDRQSEARDDSLLRAREAREQAELQRKVMGEQKRQIEAQQREMRKVFELRREQQMKQAEELRAKAEEMRRKAMAQSKAAAKSRKANDADKLMQKLRADGERIEAKESEIEMMRRELEMLKKELGKLRGKKKDKDEDED